MQTTDPANFQASNDRPSPIVDDQASLTLAGFNGLNFWNGDGVGGGFPTERGARDIETYNQQLSKLVSAIVGLNADVFALQELENDGYEELSAIDSLVDALNAVSDSAVYAYVTVPDALLNGGIGRSELVAADLISAGGLAHEIPSHNSVTTELEFRSLINAFAHSRGESANFEAVTPFDSNFANGISATVGDLSFSWNVSGHGADAGAGTGPHATRDGSGLSFSDAEFQSMLSLGLLGTDAIANGFIYRTDAVRLAPDTGVAVLDLGYTRVGGDPATDEANRPVIAVSFEEISSGEVFTAVSVHFKSKGSIAQGDGNEDLGDGAGNSNGQRTREAQAVVDWLETDPTNSNDSDVIVLGDLNAYSMEDPLMVFRDAGYTNLVGTDDYTYQFRGQFGSLDHALVSDSMLFPITSASPWHINSDEPVALTTGNYQYAQNPENYYAADAFASSDHDPIVVGLDFDRANSLDGFYPDPLRATAGNDDTLTDALDFGSSDVLFMGSGDDVADAAIVSGRENTMFTGSGDDVVYASHRDVVIGGSGNDSAYLTEDGDNRVAGNDGFDVFHVGTSGNRVLGGADDDVINVLGGAGINYLRGGDGYDAFWLVSAAGDRPAEAQMVMDFNPEEDVVGLAGVSYESLAFEQVGSDTRLSVNGSAVGVFRDINSSTLSDISHFAGLLA